MIELGIFRPVVRHFRQIKSFHMVSKHIPALLLCNYIKVLPEQHKWCLCLAGDWTVATNLRLYFPKHLIQFYLRLITSLHSGKLSLVLAAKSTQLLSNYLNIFHLINSVLLKKSLMNSKFLSFGYFCVQYLLWILGEETLT